MVLASRSSQLLHSLSFIVPARTLGRMLDDRLRSLLDILPDYAASFEVLIVDDGCEDSVEAADRVRCEFAQVRVVRPEADDPVLRRTAARYAVGRDIAIYDARTWSLTDAVQQIRALRGDGMPQPLHLRTHSGAPLKRARAPRFSCRDHRAPGSAFATRTESGSITPDFGPAATPSSLS